MKRYYLSISLIMVYTIFFYAYGFAPGTYVRISKDNYKSIENLKKNDRIETYEVKSGTLISNNIDFIDFYTVTGIISLGLEGFFSSNIQCIPDQKILCFNTTYFNTEWHAVKNLNPGDTLITANGIKTINWMTEINQQMNIYDICTRTPYPFCVSFYDIVTCYDIESKKDK